MKYYDKPIRNLYETLVESEKRFPDKPAVIDDKETVSYRELKRRVDTTAYVLKNRCRIQKQQQIAVLMANSANTVVVFYAAMKLGCIALMINTKFREAEIDSYLRDMDAKVIFSDPEWLDKIRRPAANAGIQTIFTDIHFEIKEKEDISMPCTADGEDTAVIMHTSGTTGKPKGVMVSQQNILEAAYGYQEVQGLDENAVSVLSVPLFHILGLSCVTTHFIYLGATIVLSAFYHVEDVLRKIREYKATHFHSVPTIYKQMIEYEDPDKDLTTLTTAVCGGAPIEKEYIEAFCTLAPNAVLHLAYGMTETAGSGTLSWEHKGPLKPVPNVEMTVVDQNHRELPPGEIGELVFIGPCVAQKRWQADSLPDDHMYSGDVGYMDEEGHVFVIDRLKDIINRGGEKIFPIQVEEVIRHYPGIHDVSVYAISSDKYGESPAAAVIPEPGVSLNIDALKEYLSTRIAKYKMPVLIRVMDSFPITLNGKVRKAELRRLTETGGCEL